MDSNSMTDKWLWRMYREVAQYVHAPTAANEAELLNLISQYRKQVAGTASAANHDEHEWAMDYR